MKTAQSVVEALELVSTPERALNNAWFFKTGPGQYGQGDQFLGVNVPEQRKISRYFYNELDQFEVVELLYSHWHEARLTALFVMVLQYQKGSTQTKEKIVESYLENTKYVNNWDLVDSSAPYILGDWLLDKDRTILYKLSKSEILWERRISMISTLNFIRNDDFSDALLLAEQLLGDKEDLMHKAVGWCLREVGKKAEDLLTDFLDKHATVMPRTALRYSIERLPEQKRKYYLNLK